MRKKSRLLLSSMLLLALLTLTGCHKHEFKEATCTEPATCISCGQTEGEPLTHSFTKATCTEAATCIRCGETKGEPLGHDFREATCTEPKTCNRCGVTEGDIKAHDYKEATCTEPKTCVDCGATTGEALGHAFSGECEGLQTCSHCGDTRLSKGHEFTEATCTESKVCKNCGVTEGDPLGHNLVDGKCSRCGMEIGSIESIKSVCGLTAACEEDRYICVIDIDTAHNPYDVEYDYGEEYDQIVKACDWSLVFDADYYMKAYPMLTYLYHEDKDLLLEHFQTVGIHEGRQGCKNFNVGAYLYNCSDSVYNAFDHDYEGYYLYYMLNYETEKEVNTVTANNGKDVKTQYKIVYTAVQKEELENINKYRAAVDSPDVEYNAELQAFANYRGYINVKENWDAHDWMKQNNDKAWELIGLVTDISGNGVGENNVTLNRYSASLGKTMPFYYEKYYNSPEHYDCMVSPKYSVVGVSNTYLGQNNKLNTYKKNNSEQGAQFDIYLKFIK